MPEPLFPIAKKIGWVAGALLASFPGSVVKCLRLRAWYTLLAHACAKSEVGTVRQFKTLVLKLDLQNHSYVCIEYTIWGKHSYSVYQVLIISLALGTRLAQHGALTWICIEYCR